MIFFQNLWVTDDYVNYRDHTEPSVYDDASSNKEKQIGEIVTPNYWAKNKRNIVKVGDLL